MSKKNLTFPFNNKIFGVNSESLHKFATTRFDATTQSFIGIYLCVIQIIIINYTDRFDLYPGYVRFESWPRRGLS
jgi:hypothetical protein